MYIFILILIMLLGSIFLIANLDSRLKKWHIIILLLFLSIVSGIRYDVGIDYSNYEFIYNNDLFKIFPEVLYWGVSHIVRFFGGGFYIITLFMGLLTNYYIYKGLQVRNIKTNYMILAIFIFLSSFWLDSFNIMRQCLSVSIFFYASVFIKKRKMIPYILYILLAAGFHKSSLFLIPLYFIPYININKYMYIILIIISYLIVNNDIAQYLLSYVSSNIKGYDMYAMSNNIFTNSQHFISFGVIIDTLISLYIVLFNEKKLNENNLMEKNFYIYGCILNILSISTYMYNRVGIYFKVFGIYLIPYIISNIENKVYRIIMYSIILVLVISLYLNQSLFASPEYMMQYKTIFSL